MLKYTQSANVSDHLSRKIEQILAQGKTEFQEFLFFSSKMHGICIALDGDIQSCESDEAIYHETLVHPAMLLHQNPKRVLIMGGGEGATAREVLRHPDVEQVVMVDIDREFVELCQQLIPNWSQDAFSDPRLEVIHCDIKAYLETQDQHFDVVIGDLVDIHDWDSPVAALYGKTFYSLLKKHMAEGSLLATQGGPLVPNDMEGHNQIRQTLQDCFKQVASYGVVVPSFYHLWGFIVASETALQIDVSHLITHFSEKIKKMKLNIEATGTETLATAFILPNSISSQIR